nr:histone deacetylase 6 [Hymenolepis microstoma]
MTAQDDQSFPRNRRNFRQRNPFGDEDVQDTNTAARLAAGSLTHAVDIVTRGDVRNAFCLVRPPGHHAMKDEACGYCIFNNVAIAAKHALTQLVANRILIVDWDIHHGQGTQYAFYNDSKVLYFSIHRYDNGEYWPSLRESGYEFVGWGQSYGYNINVPLDGKDYSDIDYLTIFNVLLMPIAYEFGPDLVIVSAGYDCALGCPYGGYGSETLSDCVAHTVSALLGDPLPTLDPLKPLHSGKTVMVPSTAIDPFEKSENELRADKGKLEELRKSYRFTALADLERVCLVYDSRMENHKSEQERHPECPNRTRRAYELLEEYGLARRCRRTDARLATDEELLRVHTPEYIGELKATASMSQTEIDEYAKRFQSVYMNKHTFDSASLAGGSLLAVIDDICNGKRLRIAVVDWDLHHGNGIQHIFDDDPSVLYISIHRFDDGEFLPNSSDAAAEHVGVGESEGKNINIPWNGRYLRDGDFIAAFFHILLPTLYEFRPGIVIVAAGFDVVRGDHLGGVSVSVECFGHLTHHLMGASALSSRRCGLVLALEGGYNLNATSEALSHCVASLLSDPCVRLPGSQVPTEKSCLALRKVSEIHSKYWSSIFDYSPLNCYLHQTTVRTHPFITTNSTITVANTSTTRASSDITIPLTVTPNVTTIASFESTDFSAESSFLLPTVSISTNPMETTNPSVTTTDYQQEEAYPASQSLVSSSQPSQPQPSVSTSTTNSDAPVPGPSIGLSSSSQISSDAMRQLVEFSDVGIEDLTTFLGLNSTDPVPDRLFAVEPSLWCPHLDLVEPAGQWHPDANCPCSRCDNRQENWVCLTCYEVYCGRYAQGHMLEHYNTSQHPIVLSLADLSAWCYVCNGYIHNEILLEAKRALHLAKFGVPMPG